MEAIFGVFLSQNGSESLQHLQYHKTIQEFSVLRVRQNEKRSKKKEGTRKASAEETGTHTGEILNHMLIRFTSDMLGQGVSTSGTAVDNKDLAPRHFQHFLSGHLCYQYPVHRITVRTFFVKNIKYTSCLV